MTFAELLIQLAPADGDGDAPTVGHGVPSVDAEVHHDLLELPGVGADDSRLHSLVELDGDLLADDPFEEIDTPADRLAEIEELRLHDLSSAEGEQLAGETGATLGAIVHDVHLAEVVQLADLRADLHMHTTWSDGRLSILEMAEAARSRRLSYIVISDHSASLGIANGLSIERLWQQREEIAAANEKLAPDFTILHGTEMEIKADGTLDSEVAQNVTVESELKRLREENRQLRMERDILKKATAFFAKENDCG